MRVNTWICLAGALCSSAVYAGGVGLGATRLVYSSATSQAMMQVIAEQRKAAEDDRD